MLLWILGLEPTPNPSSRAGLLECAYSFCASMIISVESFGDAVDRGSPSRSRNDLTCVADAILVSIVCLLACLLDVVVGSNIGMLAVLSLVMNVQLLPYDGSLGVGNLGRRSIS